MGADTSAHYNAARIAALAAKLTSLQKDMKTSQERQRQLLLQQEKLWHENNAAKERRIRLICLLSEEKGLAFDVQQAERLAL